LLICDSASGSDPTSRAGFDFREKSLAKRGLVATARHARIEFVVECPLLCDQPLCANSGLSKFEHVTFNHGVEGSSAPRSPNTPITAMT
jgi:hypothetical protein